MKKKWLRRIALLGLLSVVLVFTLAAQGTKDDPLVTLGYLNEKFMPQVVEQIAAQTQDRQEALEESLQDQIDDYVQEITRKINRLNGSSSGGSDAVGFAVVTLEAGHALRPDAGCELMLRSGKALCETTAVPGLVDVTAGGQLDGGALEVNHLYLATDDGRCVRADGEAVTLLVRGSYTLTIE